MKIGQMLPEGTTLMGGNLTVDRQLSSGGFGNTYVVHNRLGKVFAMKEFFMKGINLRVDGNVTVSVPDNKTTFESQRAKFEKEAKRLSMIANEHIVQVHDLFYENGTAYYTMDFIDGESLKERLERTGNPMTEAEVLIILPQLLDALSCVHGQKPALLHLDLKPANIMQDKQGKVYLIDFGSSKHADSSGGEALSTSTGFTYTQGYAPLELILGAKEENIGPWTDLYSLGATIYRLLSFSQPPEPSDIISEGVDAFHFPTSVTEQIQKLIVWLMKPDRKHRPQSVQEVREWFDNYPSNVQDTETDEIDNEPDSDDDTSFEPVVFDKPQETSTQICSEDTTEEPKVSSSGLNYRTLNSILRNTSGISVRLYAYF